MSYGSALVALFVGLGTAVGAANTPPPAPPGHGTLFASHFRLLAPDGSTVDSDDLSGQPYALFFGFTHCPDVCPTTLTELSLAFPKLPVEARDLKVYFITIDPEHDTPETLGRYMESFDPRIVGLSGARLAVDEAIRGFGVVAQRTDLPNGGASYAHTASVFLVDGDGLIVGRVQAGVGPDELAARLTALARGSRPPPVPTR